MTWRGDGLIMYSLEDGRSRAHLMGRVPNRQWASSRHVVRSVGAALGVAILVSSCGAQGDSTRSSAETTMAETSTAPAESDNAMASATSSPAPCDTSFYVTIAGFQGKESPEAALEAWLSGEEIDTSPPPDNIPRQGWSESVETVPSGKLLQAGQWRATAQQSESGGWLITQLECAGSG